MLYLALLKPIMLRNNGVININPNVYPKPYPKAEDNLLSKIVKRINSSIKKRIHITRNIVLRVGCPIIKLILMKQYAIKLVAK